MGSIRDVDFRCIISGYEPQSGRALVQNAGDANRQSGWDLTFAASKSVSIIWALSGEEVSEAIREAHQRV